MELELLLCKKRTFVLKSLAQCFAIIIAGPKAKTQNWKKIKQTTSSCGVFLLAEKSRKSTEDQQ